MWCKYAIGPSSHQARSHQPTHEKTGRLAAQHHILWSSCQGVGQVGISVIGCVAITVVSSATSPSVHPLSPRAVREPVHHKR